MAEEQQRHVHRCQTCGTVWGHGNMMQADVEAHKCPKCGRQEWRIYSGGGSPTKAVVVHKTGAWEYLRVLLAIALVSASIVFLGLAVIEWLTPSKE